MLGKCVSAAIALFWLCMMGLLFQRELLPNMRAARMAAQSTTYAQLESLAEQGRVSQMGIWFKDRRVGRTTSRISKEGNEIRLESDTQLGLSLSPFAAAGPGAAPAGGLDASIRCDARVSDQRLVDFRTVVCSPPGAPPTVVVDGYPVGESLVLKIRMENSTRTEKMPFDSRQFLAGELAPAFTRPNPRVGDRWQIRTLDTTSFAVKSAWAEVVGKETLRIENRDYDAFVVEVKYDKYTVRLWVGADGEVLKQRLFGITFIREEGAWPPRAGIGP